LITPITRSESLTNCLPLARAVVVSFTASRFPTALIFQERFVCSMTQTCLKVDFCAPGGSSVIFEIRIVGWGALSSNLLSIVASYLPRTAAVCASLHLHRIGLPNVCCVLGNCAIAGELTGASKVDYRLARPGRCVPVERPHRNLCLSIRAQISQVHEIVTTRQLALRGSVRNTPGS
jgi:hypothetical protein